jgi:acylglycerol lipase
MTADPDPVLRSDEDREGSGNVSEGRGRTGLARLERRWPASGTPVAALGLIHGINEHSGRYGAVGEALAAGGIDVLAIDLRGHGGSGGRRGDIGSFDDFLDDVEDLLAERRQLGVPVVLFGHSLGGLICTVYAESDRPQPDLLVLSAPALLATVPGALRAAAGLLGRLAPTLAMPNTIRPELLSRDPEVGRRYLDDPLRVRRNSTRLGREIFTTMVRATAGLGRIRVPTRVIHGSADRLVPPEASAGFEGRPDTTRVLYDGLRHECHNEPEGPEVLADLVTWIRGQVGRPSGGERERRS